MEFIDAVLATVLGLLIWALLTWCWNSWHFNKDEDLIYQYIKNSENTYRSTEAISSGLNLDSARIEFVCGRSKKIKRNSSAKESWCILEEG